uniref:Innexin n=1 Tax=Romanomermis culicivorax TaxID=13658 RepID=A0A915J2C2_ROMCU
MYCWAQSTYWVPFDKEIPSEVDEREHRYVSYYQWVPFFLLIVALFFYLPCLFWRLFNDKSVFSNVYLDDSDEFFNIALFQVSNAFTGVRMQKIIGIARDVENIHPETRHRNIQALALHLDSVFRHQFKISTEHSALHRFFKCLNLRYYEAYLSVLYIIIKTSFLANVIGQKFYVVMSATHLLLYNLSIFRSAGQLFLINRFLQTDDYNIYGFGVLSDLLSGRPWESSGNFPRVTLCDLLVRRLGNVHRYTVQCVLVINIFTEKIFILLWLWYSILIVITGVNLVYWTVITFTPRERIRFVSRHLELADRIIASADRDEQIREFTLDFIKMDGIFVLRMLNLHAGLMFTSDLVDALWELFDKSEENIEVAEQESASLCRLAENEELMPTGAGSSESARLIYNKIFIVIGYWDVGLYTSSQQSVMCRKCVNTKKIYVPPGGGWTGAQPRPPVSVTWAERVVDNG